MEPFNLYLMDMSHADNTSGVDRYMHTLLKGLEAYAHIKVYWIHLRHDTTILFHYEERTEFYTKITIPLPQQFHEIISQKFWINKYNEQIYRIAHHLFEEKENCILHIHTLNLIDLALYIKTHIACKIITHLHCIPWKDSYNRDKNKFNELFTLQLTKGKSLTRKRNKFLTNNSELQSYTEADIIICVTNCAKEFLQNTMGIRQNKIKVIPNGINDFKSKKSDLTKNNNGILKMLYVGVLSESKGLSYILEAMRIVQRKGYAISLTIAGKVHPLQAFDIKEKNRDLLLNVTGRIPFEELSVYYRESDVGVIASLQEQSSYVAIEMAMFGLPVITTAVDGLDEIFTDNVNALKVNTLFSKARGLTVDTVQLAAKIIFLIENKKIREQLSLNVRRLYETELTLDRMMKQTVEVYKNITREINHV
ncbi:D-inositol-3-phosphate glycosyltransferase [anaerobic digester metagenome]